MATTKSDRKKEKEEKKERKEQERKEQERKEKKELERKEKNEKKGKKTVEELVFSEFEIDGAIYKTTLPKYYRRNKKWKPKAIGDIESMITGVIKSIFVEQGTQVKQGDCLLLLEAMKMNNEILSPVDGTVQEIFVAENANVPKGTLMVKITPDIV